MGVAKRGWAVRVTRSKAASSGVDRSSRAGSMVACPRLGDGAMVGPDRDAMFSFAISMPLLPRQRQAPGHWGAGSDQAEAFLNAQMDVHGLHGSAGRPLAEVVQAGNEQHALGRAEDEEIDAV